MTGRLRQGLLPVLVVWCSTHAGADDECNVAANHQLCNRQGQECVDVNDTIPGDWECHCAGSSEGDPVIRSPATCYWDRACIMAQNRNKCTHEGQTCQRLTLDELEATRAAEEWKCVCLNGAYGQAIGKAAACISKEVAATSLYCEDIRASVCETDPICERDGSGKCVRTRCGAATTQTDCLAKDKCSWAYNAGADLPIAGLPYVLAPAYCYERQPVEDNTTLLIVLCVVVGLMIPAVLGVWCLARGTAKNLDEKAYGRQKEKVIHGILTGNQKNVEPLTLLKAQAAQVMEKIQQAPQNAPGVDELAARQKGTDEYGLPLDGSDEEVHLREAAVAERNHGVTREPQDTDRTFALSKEVNHQRFLRAEQLIRAQHRLQGAAKEAKLKELASYDQADENRTDRQMQLEKVAETNRVEHDYAMRATFPRKELQRQQEAELLLERDALERSRRNPLHASQPALPAPEDTPATPPTVAHPAPAPEKAGPGYSRRQPPRKVGRARPSAQDRRGPDARGPPPADPQQSLNYGDYYSGLLGGD